jgi:hypothetical protein
VKRLVFVCLSFPKGQNTSVEAQQPKKGWKWKFDKNHTGQGKLLKVFTSCGKETGRYDYYKNPVIITGIKSNAIRRKIFEN